MRGHAVAWRRAGSIPRRFGASVRLGGPFTLAVETLSAELGLGTGGWLVVSTLEHLSRVRIEGFESGFELDPLVPTLGAGYRFGGRR